LVKIEIQNTTFKRLCDNNFSKPIHGQIQGIEDLLKPTHIFLRDELFLLRQSAAKCVISKKQGREHTQIEN
jgi:hypothetical protein